MSPLVGRAAQLKMLDRAMALAMVPARLAGRAAGRAASVVEISGEPGIGKTRMLTELGLRADAAGLEVLNGLESIGLDRPAVRRLLESARPHGIALLLDDVHRADRLSLGLTEFLIGTSSRVPILLAVAFRSGRPPTTLVRAIACLGPAVTRIALPGLTAADLDELLPDMPKRLRHLVFRASGGNPRYARELSGLGEDALATLVDEPSWTDRCWLDGPGRDVLAATAAEIAASGPLVLTVACAVAALGEQATLDRAASVAGLPASVILPVVDELYEVGLLDFDASRLRLRHPLVRAAVRGLVGPAWWITARVRATGTGPVAVTGTLTPREREVADLVVGGLTNQEIAARLFLSRRTVECHLSRVFAKLHVHSRTAMVHRLGSH